MAIFNSTAFKDFVYQRHSLSSAFQKNTGNLASRATSVSSSRFSRLKACLFNRNSSKPAVGQVRAATSGVVLPAPNSQPPRATLPDLAAVRPLHQPLADKLETQPSLERAAPRSPMSNRNNACLYAWDEPYALMAIPVAGRTDELQGDFPTLYAWNNGNLFFVSPDGKARRFPPDTGTAGRLNRRGIWESGRRLEQQIRYIYDAPVAKIHQTIGEYVLDPEQATASFVVNGEPVQSALSEVALFPLPENKWMIPQPNLRSCTYACEAMLLAEGKNREEAMLIRRETKMPDGRREFKEIARSLTQKTGREAAPLLRRANQSDEDFILALEATLHAHGPCIFDAQGGHVRILDKIERNENGTFFTMRDPFCGSYLQIDAIAHLHTHPDGTYSDAPLISEGTVGIILKSEAVYP